MRVPAVLVAALVGTSSGSLLPPLRGVDPPAGRHRVPDGFVIEQVAGESETVFPMFACFDDRGRLFVAESSGLDLYAELAAQTRTCRVRVLEDRDGDGRFETSTVFADKLVFPMGLVWRAGKLYVADPPDLVTFEDADGDGRAEKRTVILSGFGHRDNGSLHGLAFGPDGWLYLTMGSPDGYKLRRADGSVLTGESGALIRCRPDGSDPEVVCRGFVNLVEVAWTARGEAVGTDNWFRDVNARGSGGLRDALVHLTDGGLYPYWREVGTPQPVTGDPLGPVSLVPAFALSGLARYEGAQFPPEFRGNLFTAQHNSRAVGRHVLVPDGSTYQAKDLPLVTSDDPDFHPSDVLEDADGSLLVVDTGSWYVHHCPTGSIRKTRAAGGIWRVRRAGAERPKDPWGLKVDWGRVPPEWLCGLLADARPAVRERAKRTLAARGRATVPGLAEALGKATDTAARQEVIWTLGQIAHPSALPPLRLALGHADPDTVATAA
ncbi:MAG: HEAT repeat domain-containing protein, partial [Gemmataceae bacterium]|nr:HEAT repeat domain-containing protein [Gemmataceae bacterium]